MTTPPDALRACLRLMDRAAPHPDDADPWRDTRLRASRVLAHHAARTEERRSLARGLAAWVAVGAVTAIAINLIWG